MKALVQLILLTAKHHEGSWQKKNGGGIYALSIYDAALEAGTDDAGAELMTIILSDPVWNDTLAWAERQRKEEPR